MPIGLQAKVLRFLENGEIQRVGDNDTVRVNVRVIAATHQDLEARATAGDFRLDLYHRLAVFPIDIPPLRERLADIAALSEHFLALMGRNSPRKSLSAAALDKLYAHDWPGNVRELAHVLERASILAADSPTLRAEDIRLPPRTQRLIPLQRKSSPAWPSVGGPLFWPAASPILCLLSENYTEVWLPSCLYQECRHRTIERHALARMQCP